MNELLLITGIPGTGKTTYGAAFADQFSFTHHNLEEQSSRTRLETDPSGFIKEIAGRDKAVATWGFLPDPIQIRLVLKFRTAGLKLIWFDGNRPAALAAFIRRRTVPEIAFYAQMCRIEESRVIEQIQPAVLNPFDSNCNFKSPAEALREIRLLR